MLHKLLIFANRRPVTHCVLLLQGALQEVHLISGPHGYLTQCPHLSSTCPTCGQFSLLQNTVEQLTKHLHELSERVGKCSVFLLLYPYSVKRGLQLYRAITATGSICTSVFYFLIFYIKFNYVRW